MLPVEGGGCSCLLLQNPESPQRIVAVLHPIKLVASEMAPIFSSLHPVPPPLLHDLPNRNSVLVYDLINVIKP